MRLRTKLVLLATGVTFAIVSIISLVFLGQLTRQRIEQTSTSNDVLAHEVLLVTRQALETGLRAHPPLTAPPAAPNASSDDALHAAVLDALRSSESLRQVMSAIIRYSPTVQDVSVTDAHGFTLVSTDEDTLNQPSPYRASFSAVASGSLVNQLREVFGKPRVLDISAPLDRNGLPFLVIHVGVRSTFLRNAFEPWLRAALLVALFAAVISMAAAALLSAVALRPLVTIGEQLERLTLAPGEPPLGPLLLEARRDPIGRVNRSIDRLGREMRSREEGYTALQANLAHVLDTLRDGVVLFTPERRAVMVSDAVAYFIPPNVAELQPARSLVGRTLDEIFPPGTVLGDAIADAFNSSVNVSAEAVLLEDGRQVQISLDRIDDPPAAGQPARAPTDMGTLLTLRDTASALELEQELEVSRRLASIGRLTANVGHEVKNPINAMVVHLELLRSKLSAANVEPESARKHVDILADEMHRLDRVVQTLADFSRPLTLELRDQDLRRIVDRVLDLSGAELKANNVTLEISAPPQPLPVRVDSELIRQAILNLVLNAMQAMPAGGALRVTIERQARLAVVQIADTGSGIPASILPRIFDLYFTTKPTGSGIGLAMTYRILQLHGGALDVRSNTDPAAAERGTVFILRIPIALAPAAEARRPLAAPRESPATPTSSTNGATIQSEEHR
ncbi:MAG: ATP-binding protein [Acidobacteriota bacterium]|nr:ATP-binding protein [Acidobacteriota bacterium]